MAMKAKVFMPLFFLFGACAHVQTAQSPEGVRTPVQQSGEEERWEIASPDAQRSDTDTVCLAVSGCQQAIGSNNRD